MLQLLFWDSNKAFKAFSTAYRQTHSTTITIDDCVGGKCGTGTVDDLSPLIRGNNNNNNVRLTCQGQTNCMNQRHGQSLGEGIGSFSETES